MNEFTVQDFGDSLNAASNMAGDINSILESLASIFSFASVGVYAVFSILAIIFAGILALALYIFQSIPIYTLAKKVGLQHAWLAWIPFFHSFFRLFVLCEIAKDKPLDIKLFNFKFENRKFSFLTHLLIYVFGGTVVTTVVLIASFVVPVLGSVSSVLSFLPMIACGIIEYAYFRDVLDIFKPDKKSNDTTAIVITVIDTLLFGDLIRSCYLYTLLKKEPLPEEVIVESADCK